MKITFCLAVGLVTGVMFPLQSHASENQVPQTPAIAPINSIQTSPKSSPTGFNERLSDTSNPSESVSGSGKTTETLSDTSKPSVSKPSVTGREPSQSPNTVKDSSDGAINADSKPISKPDSESVTPDKAEENTETPMTTRPTPKTDASDSKNTTTETTNPSTGASSPMGQMNNINSSPAVIKDGQMPQKPDDDKAADPSSSSKPTSSNITPKTNKTTTTSPTTTSPTLTPKTK